MSDIEIIKKLEQKLPRKLKQLENITWFSKGYILNEQGRVTHLSIFNVRLKGEFPEEIFMLNELEYLDIRENGLASVPAEINKLQKLRYLDIRYNELSELPERFSDLSALERLYLGYNGFETVPDNLDGLQNLFLIDFTENRVKGGVEKLFELPRLTNIYFNQNRLKTFPFEKVPPGKIKELNISDNMIIEIPDSAYDKIGKIIF